MKPPLARKKLLQTNYHEYWALRPDRPDRHHSKSRFDKFRDLPEVTKPVWCFDLAEYAMVLAAGVGSEVHLWDLLMDPPELKVTLRAHKAHVWCVLFSTNETVLATGSSDKTVRLWVAESGMPLGVLEAHTEGVRCLAFSYDGMLLSGGMDSQICLWEYDNMLPTAQWKAHDGNVHWLSFPRNPMSSQLNVALSVGADGSVAAWYVRPGHFQALGRFPGGGGGGVLCVAQHPTEEFWCACGNEDGGVWVWNYQLPEIENDTAKSEQTETLGNVKLVGHKQGVRTLAFTMDGCLLASGSSDGFVRVWDIRAMHEPLHEVCCVAIFRAHDSWVTQVRFEGGARGMVTCSSDGLVKHFVAPNRLKRLARKAVPIQKAPEPPPVPEVPAPVEDAALESARNRTLATFSQEHEGEAPLSYRHPVEEVQNLWYKEGSAMELLETESEDEEDEEGDGQQSSEAPAAVPPAPAPAPPAAPAAVAAAPGQRPEDRTRPLPPAPPDRPFSRAPQPPPAGGGLRNFGPGGLPPPPPGPPSFGGVAGFGDQEQRVLGFGGRPQGRIDPRAAGALLQAQVDSRLVAPPQRQAPPRALVAAMENSSPH